MDLQRFGILILLLVVIGSVAFGGYYYFLQFQCQSRH